LQKPDSFAIGFTFEAVASIIQGTKVKQNCSILRTISCMHAVTLLGFGARGTFRPLWSDPDQARHLPEAPVPWPRKSVQSHTRRDTQGVPRATSR